MTSNANVKTLRIRLSGSGGTIFYSLPLTGTALSTGGSLISNTGSVSKQISQALAQLNNGNNATTNVLGTVNTGVATTAVISIQRATATDTIIILPPTVEVML